MVDEMQISAKTYISSKRAALETGYTQDYIGQLARKGLIDAQRVAGLWYVDLDSVKKYKSKADEYTPTPPTYSPAREPEALVSFDGKEYISANRAAQITGYNQDYIGQLARTGKIISRQVGNRWYLDNDALLAHKKEKDGLLAAVQAESVGIIKPVAVATEVKKIISLPNSALMRYTTDESALLPVLKEKISLEKVPSVHVEKEVDDEAPAPHQIIPIKVIKPGADSKSAVGESHSKKAVPAMFKANTIVYILGPFLIVLVLMFLYLFLNSTSIRVAQSSQEHAAITFTDRINQYVESLLSWVEDELSPNLDYIRAE